MFSQTDPKFINHNKSKVAMNIREIDPQLNGLDYSKGQFKKQFQNIEDEIPFVVTFNKHDKQIILPSGPSGDRIISREDSSRQKMTNGNANTLKGMNKQLGRIWK